MQHNALQKVLKIFSTNISHFLTLDVKHLPAVFSGHAVYIPLATIRNCILYVEFRTIFCVNNNYFPKHH
jgi:hypothetical protein